MSFMKYVGFYMAWILEIGYNLIFHYFRYIRLLLLLGLHFNVAGCNLSLFSNSNGDLHVCFNSMSFYWGLSM